MSPDISPCALPQITPDRPVRPRAGRSRPRRREISRRPFPRPHRDRTPVPYRIQRHRPNPIQSRCPNQFRSKAIPHGTWDRPDSAYYSAPVSPFRRNHNGGVNRQLGMLVAHHHDRRRDLRHRKLGQLAFCCLQNIAVSASATSTPPASSRISRDGPDRQGSPR